MSTPDEDGDLIPAAFREQVRRDMADAFGVSFRHAPPPRRVRWLRARLLLGRLKRRHRVRQLTEAEFAAMLPYRAQRITDEMNERLADVLPPGARFEFEGITSARRAPRKRKATQ